MKREAKPIVYSRSFYNSAFHSEQTKRVPYESSHPLTKLKELRVSNRLNVQFARFINKSIRLPRQRERISRWKFADGYFPSFFFFFFFFRFIGDFFDETSPRHVNPDILIGHLPRYFYVISVPREFQPATGRYFTFECGGLFCWYPSPPFVGKFVIEKTRIAEFLSLSLSLSFSVSCHCAWNYFVGIVGKPCRFGWNALPVLRVTEKNCSWNCWK